jgi:hypothetical protein
MSEATAEHPFNKQGASGAFRKEDPSSMDKKVTRKVVVNTNACRGPIMECLADVMSKRTDFELKDDPKSKFDDIFFVITRESLNKRIRSMGKKACVSRIPGMYASTSNPGFARCMELTRELLPYGVKPFWPETFVVPDEMHGARYNIVVG